MLRNTTFLLYDMKPRKYKEAYHPEMLLGYSLVRTNKNEGDRCKEGAGGDFLMAERIRNNH